MGKQFNFCARTVNERGENTLTLTFIGDLDFQYNSCIVMYTIKLNNIEKNIKCKIIASVDALKIIAH